MDGASSNLCGPAWHDLRQVLKSCCSAMKYAPLARHVFDMVSHANTSPKQPHGNITPRQALPGAALMVLEAILIHPPLTRREVR